MSTLYELTSDLLTLYEMADDPDVDADVLADTIEAVNGELEVKADGYAKVISQLKGDMKLLKEEEERLYARRKAIEKSIETISNRLKDSMILTGKTKFKTLEFSFSIRKNPLSVKVSDGVSADDVPEEFIGYGKPTIDKTKVKEALESGADIGWASLEQGESLQIR